MQKCRRVEQCMCIQAGYLLHFITKEAASPQICDRLVLKVDGLSLFFLCFAAVGMEGTGSFLESLSRVGHGKQYDQYVG